MYSNFSGLSRSIFSRSIWFTLFHAEVKRGVSQGPGSMNRKRGVKGSPN